MDIAEILSDIDRIMDSLHAGGLSKAIITVFIAILTSTHTQLFLAFVMLVVLDLVTKWLHLSRQHLIDTGEDSPPFYHVLFGIGSARRDGYIRSAPMKGHFISKISVYLLLTTCAAMADGVMRKLGLAPFWAVLIVGYLSACEMLSIVENLKSAGVEEARKLKEIIEKKKGMI